MILIFIIYKFFILDNDSIRIIIKLMNFFFFLALATSPAIVYITEVAKPEYRGALISMCPTIASLGMLYAFYLLLLYRYLLY